MRSTFALPHRPVLAIGALLAVAALALSGCSGGDADTTAAVTGTDDACDIATDVLQAGTIAFEFTNEGEDVSELYVLDDAEEVVGEVENVTTGTTRTLKVDLVAGDYQVRCKPGMTGDGITSPFTVTGDGGTPQAEPGQTIEFEAIDFGYENLDLSTISAEDTVRFEMENIADQPHEFEVLNPDGDPIGEVAATAPGESAGATMTFGEAGQYRYQCILIDPDTGEKHSTLGMEGDFEVPEG
ncbi:MAG: cupredoxin domain-containing protein [Microthrixaceae bacterium]